MPSPAQTEHSSSGENSSGSNGSNGSNESSKWFLIETSLSSFSVIFKCTTISNTKAPSASAEVLERALEKRLEELCWRRKMKAQGQAEEEYVHVKEAGDVQIGGSCGRLVDIHQEAI